MDSGSEESPAAPRQRWRLVLGRSSDAPALAGRDIGDAWEEALASSRLPLYRAPGRARGRVAFGAAMPAVLSAEHELADIVLTEAIPAWQVREELLAHIPRGWRLIDVYDVWLGAPALAGQVAAADYRVEIADAEPDTVATAAEALLAARALQRQRPKGGSVVAYDLRPLLVDVHVAEPGPPLLVRMRTRFHPVLGTGRPEEVVAALGEVAGRPLTIGSVVRERLILNDELENGERG